MIKLKIKKSAFIILYISFFIFFVGCGGYTSKSLYSQDLKSVYVEMFDNTTFWRDIEYDLTDALAKRIESDTPYKVISDRSKADSILSGKVTGIGIAPLSLEPQTGRPLEYQAEVSAQFEWKDLRTGQFIAQKTVTASTSFSYFMDQGYDYAYKVAANKLAERITEEMQMPW